MEMSNHIGKETHSVSGLLIYNGIIFPEEPKNPLNTLKEAVLSPKRLVYGRNLNKEEAAAPKPLEHIQTTM